MPRRLGSPSEARLTEAVAFVLGFVAGAALVWGVHRDELRYLRKELALATDRLVHAWRDDKAVIPPRPPEPTPPLQPLPRDLQAEVDQWESPETRRTVERKIREMVDRGMGQTAILLALDNQHPA